MVDILGRTPWCCMKSGLDGQRDSESSWSVLRMGMMVLSQDDGSGDGRGRLKLSSVWEVDSGLAKKLQYVE